MPIMYRVEGSDSLTIRFDCVGSAYFSPEMARQHLSSYDSSSEATTLVIKASVQLEMWNFGVMMYVSYLV